MTVLKYWSTQNSAWELVGPPPQPAGYIEPGGGTVTGDLVVDTGQLGDAQIITNGTVQTPSLKGGVFDGNIRLTAARPVTLGGARAQGAAAPVSVDSAATKGYIDGRIGGAGNPVVPALTSPWKPLPGHSAPGYRKDGTGKYVMMQGVFTTTGSVVPGTSSPVLFTLQVGYRPPAHVVFAVIGLQKSLLTCNVFPDGRVQLYAGPTIPTGSWVSLDGCRFLLV